MWTRTSRFARRLTAAVGVSAMVLCVAPSAAADPAGGAVVDAPTLSFTDLGASSTLSFYGETSSTTLSFPVPRGVVPVALNTIVSLPFAMRSGLLTVTQEDRLISKVGLPLTDMAPLVIPLPGVQVVNDSVTVNLKLSDLADDRYCLDQLNPVELTNGSVTFAGREAPPTNLADFLPAIARKLTIAVPGKPSQAESDAAVQLATTLVTRYRAQSPEVLVVPLADGATAIDAPSLPMERQFVIKEGGDAGLAIEGSGGVPQLLITGPADKLVDQVRFLTDSSIGMAVGRRAVAGPPRNQVIFPGNSATLAQLGQQSLTGSGVAPQVSIGLDQTRFGHSVQGYRLHLMGSYTPLPNTFGSQLSVRVNDEVLDTWAPEASGVIDRWVSVPDRLLQRYTSVLVSMGTTGNVGRCNEYWPATLTINGNTVVDGTPALPPIPAGFGSLPQALMPNMSVGIAADSFADTVRAVELAAGLQRLSVMPLRTEVTSVEKALAGGDPAVIVSADGWTDQSITLPVRADGGLITVEGPDPGDPQTTLTLDPAVRFGSLQTVFDGKRSLLIATSTGAPAQLDELLRWLHSDPTRWSQLRGNAMVAFPERPPASVMGRTPPSVGGPVISDAGQGMDAGQGIKAANGHSTKWWIAVCALAAAAGGAAGIVISGRRRESRRTPANPPSEESS